VYAGDPVSGTPPIHFSILHDIFPERDQRVKRLASDTIEALVGKYGEALLRLYFRFVHLYSPFSRRPGYS
jgi:NCS1 family nucleobase:cation symporter-1